MCDMDMGGIRTQLHKTDISVRRPIMLIGLVIGRYVDTCIKVGSSVIATRRTTLRCQQFWSGS
jgi:hypothetical protein